MDADVLSFTDTICNEPNLDMKDLISRFFSNHFVGLTEVVGNQGSSKGRNEWRKQASKLSRYEAEQSLFSTLFLVGLCAGFYLSPHHSMCAECDCHPMGASQRACESQTGQCVCGHPSVGGRRCDQCRDMFFGFNPGLARYHV